MRNAVKWPALILGVLLLLHGASSYMRMSVAMQDSGGFPWSWDFLQFHLVRFVVIPVIGLVLLAIAIILFVRGR
ncbi:MAG TPA: hypothetical protein VK472_03450 [Allosphingosinicella sp.]|nr:hypothetical protein [Allosphingosinicella sp.]